MGGRLLSSDKLEKTFILLAWVRSVKRVRLRQIRFAKNAFSSPQPGLKRKMAVATRFLELPTGSEKKE
jgi:hypothetical protein